MSASSSSVARRLYRGDRPAPDVAGKTVLVVDDGLATGSTMLAAVQALRSLCVGRIVVAVPTAPRQTCEALEDVADEVVCLRQPDPFYASVSYEDFAEVSDDEVRALLGDSSTRLSLGLARGRV